MKTERIHYFDIAKGIFIILVFFHHLLAASHEYEVFSSYFYLITSWQSLYASFFMQAFFFITGYCSNYNNSFAPFLRKNLLALIVPSIFFSILSASVQSLYFDRFVYLTHLLDWKFWILTPQYWFLYALFWAKIIFWFINKYIGCYWLRLSIGLLFLIMVPMLKELGIANFFCFFHGLAAILFISLGQIMKLRKNTLKYFLDYLWIIYPITLLLTKAFHHDIPSLTYGLNVSIINIPLFLITSISGVFCSLKLCSLIKESLLLEYFGRDSMLFYCASSTFLGLSSAIVFRFIMNPTCVISAFLVFILIIIVSLFLCAITNEIFKTPYLRFFAGR